MPTTFHEIASDWVEIADGPCRIEAVEGTVLVHFGDAAPVANTTAYHKLRHTNPVMSGISNGGAEKAFVRSSARGAKLVVTGGAQ